jgi:hypothetical protein
MVLKLAVGLKKTNNKIYGSFLNWDTSNGIIIAGRSGSGKSNTAAHYLTQLAAQGVKLIICDYNGGGGTGQSLIERIEHLGDAFLWPAVTEEQDIIRYIESLHELGKQRLKGKIPISEHFPIVFVIDEFSSFVANTPPPVQITTIKEGDTKTITRAPTYMQRALDMLITVRKANMRVIVMGQNWLQSGTTSHVRAFRSNFSDIVLHGLSARDAGLFIDDRDVARVVETLKTGQIYYNGNRLYVPLLNSRDIEWAQKKIMLHKQRFTSKIILPARLNKEETMKINKSWSNARLLCWYLNIPWSIKYHNLYESYAIAKKESTIMQ